jgi:fructan beta-fructosidase
MSMFVTKSYNRLNAFSSFYRMPSNRKAIKTEILWICILFFLIPTYLSAQYQEKYRPQYHFSPLQGWVGDPDGLIKYKDQYHLFWWGHAVSNDLVHWKELPYPMKGGKEGYHYFSGSVVVDKSNTAGFGDSSIIAVYTEHKNDNVPEAQAISYGNDGVSFHYFSGNPVLNINSNSFRDPQVFWYNAAERWMMIVTHPKQHKVSFYSSSDLKQWTYLSDFGPMGSYNNDWEVPDIFELPVDGDKTKMKWVLTIGQGPNQMQYFLGNFDGTKFTSDSQILYKGSSSQSASWADYGTDFYAARTWRNFDDTTNNRIIWLGWMGNWSYARNVPTSWGKGFESIPRDLSLKTFPEGVRLVQTPVPELKMLRRDSVSFKNKPFKGTAPLNEFKPLKNVYEIEAGFDIKGTDVVGFNLLVGDGRKLVIGYSSKEKALFIDRSNCSDFISDSVFNKNFPQKIFAPLTLNDRLLDLHIFVDQSSVEVFADNGKLVMSATTFPSESQTGIETFSKEGKTKLVSFKAWNLASIWR